MAAPFVYDQMFAFDVCADTLWNAVTDTDRYQQWWPWLVGFDLDALATGERAWCEIQAPLPYRLRFEVDLQDVTAPRTIQGHVVGDIEGPAAFTVSRDGAGSRAHLAWELRVTRRLLAGLATIARPALLWGHDHIVEVGLRQFVTRALDDGAPTRKAM
jgi:hypothetical protein